MPHGNLNFRNSPFATATTKGKFRADYGFMPQATVTKTRKHPQRPAQHRPPAHEDNTTQHRENGTASHHQIRGVKGEQYEIR
jgi:hypothetical protein